jgi:hypothetical protein
MATRRYQKRGLVFGKGDSSAEEGEIRDLQRDLRAIGYLKQGIDGRFGAGTERAVKALQYDLMNNDGRTRGNDGNAPVRVVDFNRGRIVAVTGIIDQKLAGCLVDMVDHPDFPLLPKTDHPKEENTRIHALIKNMPSQEVPMPFIIAILKQESNLKHFNEPSKNDEDTYIVIGLDTNATEKHIITSRGYGAGQYTLFHHPPRKDEVEDFMLDVEKNVDKAVRELKYKFDHFVNGNTTGTRADDRIAEYGEGPLRMCKYPAEDPKHMRDCKQCMIDAGRKNIREGVTHFYRGSKHTFEATQYYKNADYDNVPIRKNVACDWPYAARRYNGSGINSYHYQIIVLKNLLAI